jgi:hypothetical protein
MLEPDFVIVTSARYEGMMNMYFDKKDSAKFNYGNDTKEILAHLINDL